MVTVPGPSAGVIALHGWSSTVPDNWELAGTTGHARQGWLLLACGREPQVRLSWRRHAARPDLDRSLDRAGSEILRRDRTARLAVRRAPDDRQRWGEWDGPSGIWHAAVRHFPEAQLTMAAAGLRPDVPVGGLVAAADARPADAPWRWCAYGLDAELPAWWRLTGIQVFAGLTRALWERRPGDRFRADQMLVLRRLACAGRTLAGRDPGRWLLEGLDRRERAEAVVDEAGAWRVEASRPATAWLWRLRGGRDRRVLHAWIEEDADRLLVQEWRGDGTPAPCLRRPVAAEAVP